MDIEDNTLTKSTGLNNFIKKSLSTIGVNVCNQNLVLRETKSLTGNLGELKLQNTDHGGNADYHDEFYAEIKSYESHIDEKGYETREVISNQIFVVRDEMLTYRGTRYSLSDIATKWKKDCRMWLWKSNKHRKNKSVGELREKLQNVKLHN